jgi:hypothetical protein
MVTLPADLLQPRQWFCHRDDAGREETHMRAASVLYLFHDAGFGGTSLYRPIRPMHEIEQLVHDSGVLDAEAFSQRWGVPAGYMHGSNDYFERVLQVPARFNRAVFYDGGLFHCSDNGPAGALPDDPRTGRLTLNGFFGARHALANKPLRSPDDFKGVAFRVPPTLMWLETFKALGTRPVTIPWPEIYSAMQQGVADAVEAPLASLWGMKLH